MINTAEWGWPQYIHLSLSLLTLLGYFSMHGKAREPYNGYAGLCNFLISYILLVWGGFLS